MYLCLCRGLTENDVRRSARRGNTTAQALICDLQLDDPGCCGRCARRVDRLVLLALDECRKPVVETAS